MSRLRVLVTGAAGLLGRVALIDRGASDDVYALVHRRPVDLPGVKEVVGDILDPGSLRAAFDDVRPDLVLHAAALAGLEACESAPQLAHRVNVDGTAAVAELCSRHGSRLVHLSTDAVFDGLGGPYRETDRPQPPNVYARTKLAAERACLAAHPAALVARVNFFGWSQTGTRSLAEFFHNALREGRAVHGYTDVEFTSLYNRDLVAILVQASAHGLYGVFHVGSSDALSKFDFGRALATEFGFDPELVRPSALADRPGAVTRSSRLSMDSSAIASALGRRLPSFAEGIRRMRQDWDSGYAARVRGHERTEQR